VRQRPVLLATYELALATVDAMTNGQDASTQTDLSVIVLIISLVVPSSAMPEQPFPPNLPFASNDFSV